MKINASGYSHAGNRPENQDFILLEPGLGLYMICDGMGGHSGGRIASEQSAIAVASNLAATELASDAEVTVHQMAKYLFDAVGNACREVFSIAEKDLALKGMGSTLTAVLVRGSSAVLAHVGDSRCYLLREGKQYQLSNDHTYVEELVKEGLLTREQANGHPYAHVLTRAVGATETIPVDMLKFEVVAGDILMLCSDGFYNRWQDITEQRIMDMVCESVKAPNFDEAVAGLVTDTVTVDGSDNTSAIVIEIASEVIAKATALARKADVYLELETIQGIQLFKDCSFSDILKIMSVTEVFDISPTHEIVKEGDTDDALYIVVRGEFKVTKKAPIGQVELATISSGGHFGDIALLVDTPRTATVTCTAPARVLRVPRKPLSRLFASHPRLGLQFYAVMTQTLARRLVDMNERFSTGGGTD
jgi:PPM family protein phosphatase